jgi:hypothetical protein
LKSEFGGVNAAHSHFDDIRKDDWSYKQNTIAKAFIAGIADAGTAPIRLLRGGGLAHG